MGLLSWIIVGLIAGWLANQVMRGGRGNMVTDIVVGIVGGWIGAGWLEPCSVFRTRSTVST